MRIILLVLVSVNLLFANVNFWSELNRATIILFGGDLRDGNITKDNFLLKSKEKLKSTSQERINFYKNIINVVKNEPVKIDDEAIDFYNEEKAIEKTFELENLKTRKKSLNNISVNFKLLRFELDKKIYDFLRNITYDLDNLNIANVKYRVESEKIFLGYFNQDIKMFKDDMVKFKENKRRKTEIILQQIDDDIKELEVRLNMYKNFIDYLYEQKDEIFEEKSVVKQLALNKSIDVVNQISNGNEYIAKINKYLVYIHTDIGRLTIFFIVIIFFWLMRYFSDHLFIPFLKKKLDTPEEDAYDVMLYNFDNIKKPLTYLVRIFGVDLAVDVLTYPKESPEVVNHIFSLMYIISIAWLLMVLIDLIVAIFMESQAKKSKKELRKELVNLMIKVSKVIVFITSSLIFLNQLGFDITAILTSLGIGGFAVALAAKDTIANFFSSLKIIFEEAFSQGDWIESGDIAGTVVELGFGSTKVRTFDNALISVPNSVLANQSVKNWSKRSVGRRIKMHIGVTYNSNRKDLQKAVEEIKELFENHPSIATERKTRTTAKASRLVKVEDKYGIKKTLLVYLDQFSASSMDILIYAFTKSVVWNEWLETKEELLYEIWKILEKNNLEFAFPSQSLYIENQNIDRIEEAQNPHTEI